MTSRMSERGTPAGYGIVERGTASSDVARAAERIRLAGYAVVPAGSPAPRSRIWARASNG